MALIKCDDCGKNISDTNTECPYCGCPVEIKTETEEESYSSPTMIEPTLPWEKKKKEKLTTCSKCGEEINKDFNVCPYCGTEVAKEIKKEEEIIPEPKVIKITCKECGKKFDETLEECPYCGFPKDEELTEETVNETVEEPVATPIKKGRPKKKNTTPCVECGAPIEEGEETCPECGCPVGIEIEETTEEQVEEKKIEESKKNTIPCKECGYPFEEGLDKCPECGCPTKETEIEEKVEEPIVTPPVKRGRPKKKKTIACPECGFEVEEGLESCPECGYKLTEEIKTVEEVKTEEKVEEPIAEIKETPKKEKKKKGNFGKVIFYIFICLFFIAGCATAVFLYKKANEPKDEVKEETKNYKIDSTLICLSEEPGEERVFYFSKDKLIKYALYSVEDYNDNASLENEMTNFKDEWEKSGIDSTINLNRQGYTLEKKLIIDISKSKDNTKIEGKYTKDSKKDNIKSSMEKEKWKCSIENKDLGTNIPIKDTKISLKDKLANFLENNGYSKLSESPRIYEKKLDNQYITISIDGNIYAVTTIDGYKIYTVVYDYKKNDATLTFENDTTNLRITNGNIACNSVDDWCEVYGDTYLDIIKENMKDFDTILKDANINLKKLIKE